MNNKHLAGFVSLFVVVAVVLAFACNIFATDLTMEQYEDSVAAVQKAEKIAASLPAPAPIVEKQKPIRILTAS